MEQKPTNTTIFSYVRGFSEHDHIKSHCIFEGSRHQVPIVTIAIPTYNRPLLLLESLLSALSQDTDIPYEIIVVDNNPNPVMAKTVDETIANLKSTKVSLYRNEVNIGMFGNWNRCLQLARGEWVTILSDDDLLSKNFISENMLLIHKNPEIRLIGCISAILDERTIETRVPLFRRIFGRFKFKLLFPRIVSKPNQLYNEDYLVNYPFAGFSCILMNRKCSIEIGGFNSLYYPSADAVFVTRFHLIFGSFFLPKIMACYRIGENESFKTEVLYGSIRQGLQMRGELIQKLERIPDILNLYSKMRAMETVRAYQLLFKKEDKLSELYKDIGLNGRPYYIIVNILGLYIVYYFRIQRLAKKLMSICKSSKLCYYISSFFNK